MLASGAPPPAAGPARRLGVEASLARTIGLWDSWAGDGNANAGSNTTSDADADADDVRAMLRSATSSMLAIHAAALGGNHQPQQPHTGDSSPSLAVHLWLRSFNDTLDHLERLAADSRSRSRSRGRSEPGSDGRTPRSLRSHQISRQTPPPQSQSRLFSCCSSGRRPAPTSAPDPGAQRVSLWLMLDEVAGTAAALARSMSNASGNHSSLTAPSPPPTPLVYPSQQQMHSAPSITLTPPEMAFVGPSASARSAGRAAVPPLRETGSLRPMPDQGPQAQAPDLSNDDTTASLRSSMETCSSEDAHIDVAVRMQRQQSVGSPSRSVALPPSPPQSPVSHVPDLDPPLQLAPGPSAPRIRLTVDLLDDWMYPDEPFSLLFVDRSACLLLRGSNELRLLERNPAGEVVFAQHVMHISLLSHAADPWLGLHVIKAMTYANGDVLAWVMVHNASASSSANNRASLMARISPSTGNVIGQWFLDPRIVDVALMGRGPHGAIAAVMPGALVRFDTPDTPSATASSALTPSRVIAFKKQRPGMSYMAVAKTGGMVLLSQVDVRLFRSLDARASTTLHLPRTDCSLAIDITANGHLILATLSASLLLWDIGIPGLANGFDLGLSTSDAKRIPKEIVPALDLGLPSGFALTPARFSANTHDIPPRFMVTSAGPHLIVLDVQSVKSGSPDAWTATLDARILSASFVPGSEEAVVAVMASSIRIVLMGDLYS
ncbi:hypothetical protein BC831DRAFT_440335 [Entophlyctis helioformis]|nr:hypothetical protein BC831DRAFT_440335 [Entophlyctis helioformis]